MHGARTALADAAAEFRPLEIENIAQHPQKGHVASYVDCVACAVDGDRMSHRFLERKQSDPEQPSSDSRPMRA
jgi:hypothetical protein